MSLIKQTLKRLLRFAPVPLSYFGRPHSIMIETNATCNLRCPLCPTTHMARPVGEMSLEQFRTIIDDIKGFVPKVLLWNYGEPFLHPDIFEMIAVAHQAGIVTVISTNSTKLGTEYRQQILSSGLDELIVCLDGFSTETQEAYRAGSRFEEIREHIAALSAERQAGGGAGPRIRLQFVAMKQNEHEVDAVRHFAEECGIDTFDLKTVNLWDWASGEQSRAMAEKYVPEHALSRYQFDAAGKPIISAQDEVCTWWLRSSVILWNGDVSICCYDYDGKHIAGNVFTDGGFRAVYKGKRYKALRRGIIRRSLETCRTCQASVAIRADTVI